MIKRYFVLLIAVFTIGITTACGTSVEQGEDSGANESKNGSQGNEGKEDINEEDRGQGIVAGEIEPSLTKNENGQFVYTVKNQTEKEVTFQFTSSQRYDYEVKDESGKRVFLYSSSAAFMQVLGEETLAQGEELSYTIQLPPGEEFKGGYTLEVWLTPKGGKKAPISVKMKKG
jgi:hypothetical protein